MLPLRDIVVFPHMIVPLFVGREKSIRALEEVMRADKQILLATQQNPSEDEPTPETIYDVGTLASVLQLLKLPDGTVKVLVEGVARAEVIRATPTTRPTTKRTPCSMPDEVGDEVEAEALARSVVAEFENYVKLNKKISPEVVGAVTQIEDYSKVADTVASHLAIKIPEKQAILALPTVVARLERVLGLMESEISVLQVEKRIRIARQAPDGEDAARVLPQRADEGDPEGTRRLRGRARRAAGTGGEDRQDQAVEGGARKGDRTS